MPNISLTLPETSQSVTRPVIFNIIDSIEEITKIGKNVDIRFPGDTGKMQTSGTSIDSDKDRFAIFGANKYLFIEVEEDYDVNLLGSTAVNRKEHIPVFVDKDLGIYITPVYATSNVTINFKYRTTSKTEALKWRDDIRIRVSLMRDINLHDITYHYSLPLELLVIIKTIHSKRENYLGYGDSFPEYMKSHSSERLTLIGDLINQDQRLAISESQVRIVGIYNFDGLPEKAEYEEDTGTWTVSFSYRFTYEKPTGCNMKYPVMVHNQLLPPGYTYFTNKSYDLDKVHKSFSISLDALNGFESDTIINNRLDPNGILRMPDFDDFLIKSVPKGTATAFIALTEVDTTDSKTLANLTDLGDYIIDDDILNFIRTVEYPYITSIYRSVFNICLYRNEFLTADGTIQCLSDLTIKAVNVLDLRNQHRLRFGLVTDLSMVHPSAIERLKQNPKVFVKVIGSINELIKNHPDFNQLIDRPYISPIEFNIIYQILTGTKYNGQGSNGNNYYGPGRNINNWGPNPNPTGLLHNLPNNGVPQTIDTTATIPGNIPGNTPQTTPGSIQGIVPGDTAGNIPRPNNNSNGYTSGIIKNPRTPWLYIDPRIVENYRRNNIAMKTVELTGIIALRKENL